MSPRTTLDAIAPIHGALYREVILLASPLAQFVGLIVRSEKVRLTPGAQDVLGRLEPFLVRREGVSSWPGTQLTGSRVSRRDLFALAPESIDVVLSATTDLSAWVNPYLPEDLHLVREDGSTVLGSVAQDEDAWLELDDLEYEVFRATASEGLVRSFVART